MTYSFNAAAKPNLLDLDNALNTLEASIAGSGAGASAGYATVAALRAATGIAVAWVITRGYYAEGDGGHGSYAYDATDTTTADNSGTVIVDANGKRWKLKVSTPTVSARALGVKCDGTSSGDAARLMAADVMARALNKTLYIDGIVLLDEQVWINNPTSWEFSGHGGSGGSNLMYPDSYLLIAATLPSGNSGVVVTTDAVQFHGGGIIATPGFAYDGIIIGGFGFKWTGGPVIARCGRDGIRAGDDTLDINANAFYLEAPVVCYNGRHGINIDDVAGDAGGVNVNTWNIVKPFIHHNTGHGMRFGRTYLGGTITAPLVERNTIGLYYETTASHVIVIGGDVEDNTGPAGAGTLQNVIYADDFRQFLNVMLGTVLNGVPTVRPMAISGSYTPILYGSTTGGVVTYSEQKGVYTVSNGILIVQAAVKWSAHSGTGQLFMTLPDILVGYDILTTRGSTITPSFLQASVTANLLTAPVRGQQLAALVPTNTSPPRVQFYLDDAGDIGSYAPPAAGEIYISVTIPLLNF